MAENPHIEAYRIARQALEAEIQRLREKKGLGDFIGNQAAQILTDVKELYQSEKLSTYQDYNKPQMLNDLQMLTKTCNLAKEILTNPAGVTNEKIDQISEQPGTTKNNGFIDGLKNSLKFLGYAAATLVGIALTCTFLLAYPGTELIKWAAPEAKLVIDNMSDAPTAVAKFKAALNTLREGQAQPTAQVTATTTEKHPPEPDAASNLTI